MTSSLPITAARSESPPLNVGSAVPADGAASAPSSQLADISMIVSASLGASNASVIAMDSKEEHGNMHEVAFALEAPKSRKKGRYSRHSPDVRKLYFQHRDNGLSQSEAAVAVKVSRDTAKHWDLLRDATGSMTSARRGPPSGTHLYPEHYLTWLKDVWLDNPHMSERTLHTAFISKIKRETPNVSEDDLPSLASVHRWKIEAGLDSVSAHPVTADLNTPENIESRRTWANQWFSQKGPEAPAEIIFVDEKAWVVHQGPKHFVIVRGSDIPIDNIASPPGIPVSAAQMLEKPVMKDTFFDRSSSPVTEEHIVQLIANAPPPATFRRCQASCSAAGCPFKACQQIRKAFTVAMCRSVTFSVPLGESPALCLVRYIVIDVMRLFGVW